MDQVLTATRSVKIAPPLTGNSSYRIDSIDLLRGLVMIIMALDHTRDFFHQPAWTQDPLNLSTTTPILYFTRWITHLCAPTFVFLAGAGAFFQRQRKSKKELSSFLITRGLWLLFVEIVIINFAFSFDIRYSVIGLQTIWSIGISMIVLGLMVWLPFTVILITGAVIVTGHNLLDLYEARAGFNFTNQPEWLYSLVHRPGFYKLWDGTSLLILYPFLSWAGLMMLGYGFGKLFLKYEGGQRRKVLLLLGTAILIFFIALRMTNKEGSGFHYGDPGSWTEQKNSFYTFLDFMDVQKYPPSLLFTCATIGIAILFLAAVGNVKNRLTKFITVYGRVPFFYYVLHFFLIHLVSSICFLARGHSFAEGLQTPPDAFFLPKFAALNEGYSLGVVYLVWLGIVHSLYPLCKWFSNYKQRHRDKKWLSYL